MTAGLPALTAGLPAVTVEEPEPSVVALACQVVVPFLAEASPVAEVEHQPAAWVSPVASSAAADTPVMASHNPASSAAALAVASLAAALAVASLAAALAASSVAVAASVPCASF